MGPTDYTHTLIPVTLYHIVAALVSTLNVSHGKQNLLKTKTKGKNFQNKVSNWYSKEDRKCPAIILQ